MLTHLVIAPIGGSNPPPVGAKVDASRWPTRVDLETLGKIRALPVPEPDPAAPADSEAPPVETAPVAPPSAPAAAEVPAAPTPAPTTSKRRQSAA